LLWNVQAGDRRVKIATSGFVDLASIREPCVVAATDVNATGSFTLGIASDDEIRVRVGDTEVYARSPRRTPRPGVPGGPPVSLDDLDAAISDTAERAIDVELTGLNHLAVETCRLGDDFGFFVRLRGKR
jgi:hypothetical protein